MGFTRKIAVIIGAVSLLGCQVQVLLLGLLGLGGVSAFLFLVPATSETFVATTVTVPQAGEPPIETRTRDGQFVGVRLTGTLTVEDEVVDLAALQAEVTTAVRSVIGGYPVDTLLNAPAVIAADIETELRDTHGVEMTGITLEFTFSEVFQAALDARATAEAEIINARATADAMQAEAQNQQATMEAQLATQRAPSN